MAVGNRFTLAIINSNRKKNKISHAHYHDDDLSTLRSWHTFRKSIWTRWFGFDSVETEVISNGFRIVFIVQRLLRWWAAFLFYDRARRRSRATLLTYFDHARCPLARAKRDKFACAVDDLEVHVRSRNAVTTKSGFLPLFRRALG